MSTETQSASTVKTVPNFLSRHKRGVFAALLLLTIAAASITSITISSAQSKKRKTKSNKPANTSSSSSTDKATSKKGTAKGLSPAGRAALSRSLNGRGEGDRDQEQGPEKPYTGPPVDLRPVHGVRTPALHKMPILPPPARGEDNREEREPMRPGPVAESGGPDGPIQELPGSTLSAPTAAGLAFDGVGVGVAGFQPSSNPPDTNGRVGGTQYVQWNNTSFAVFNKTTGALIYGPAAGNTLFQRLGGVCASHNDGDPVVAYDIMAGRWILSQFVVGGPSGSFSHQCVAVSATEDATGAYYLYDFLTDGTNFVDYPHIGVWPDGYYMSGHVFNAAGTANVAARVYVFERDKMILGQPARMQSKDLPKDGSGFQYGFLPADLDSLTPPPAGAQEYVIGPNAQFTNRTDISRVATVWGTTPTMTLTSTVNTTVGIGTAPCVSNTVAQQNRDCVPQAGAGGGANVPTDDLDNLVRHYMYRLAYMNHGGVESIIVTGTTTGATTTPAHGAIKWMEWRGATGSTAPTLFQSGTYDPTSTQSLYRWMSSGAMDKDGNIAIGYSKSSNTTKPGIWITGRLSTDTINTMGSETEVQAGGGVQIAGAGNRWGDYSAMTLDPVDQCTFWYTNEYLKTDGAFNWSTRIATYKFPSCTPASWGKITGHVQQTSTSAALSGVTVTLNNGFAGATDASGNYSISVPGGSYTASAADADRNCTSAIPSSRSVTVTNGITTTGVDFTVNGGSNLQGNGIAVNDSASGNNNGIVNRDECFALNIGLKNNGCADESAISSTLTTSTAGVTIIQGSSAYPDLATDATGNNATPFKVQTSSSFVCGTVIDFSLSTNYAGGSKVLTFSIPTCAGGADQTIPSSQLTTSDLSQNDREGRTGNPSTCAGKAAPGGGFTGTHRYKTFTFTNTSGAAACYTVTINAALGGPGDIESVAYDQTYNPASIDTNYLGDTGISGLGTTVGSASYAFTVPAGHVFVIVVNMTGTTLSGSIGSSVFSGIVSGFVNNNAGPGACPVTTVNTTLTPAAASGTYGGTANLSATLTDGSNGISGKSISFTLNGNSVGSANTNGSGVASLSNVSLSGINAGSYPAGVGASFAGDSGYNSSSGTAALTVNKANQTITFNALADKTYGDADFGVSATASSSLAVSFAASGNCTVSVSTVHLTGAGSCTITASQGGDSNYNAAPDVPRSFNIAKANQTITFGALADKTYGDVDFQVSASASSGLAVSFGASGNCTVTGDMVHITGAGSCTITASQGGDSNYNAAPDVPRSFNIAKANTTTTVTVSNATYDGNPHGGTANVTGPVGLNQSVTVSYSGRNTTVYGPSNTAPTNAGDYTAGANYAGESNYNSSSDSKDYSIAKANQTITFGALADKTYGDADFGVSATASSSLAVSFAASGNCTVSGSTVHLTGAGSCTITASQAGDSNYNAAADVARSFNIAKATPTITWSNPADIIYGTALSGTQLNATASVPGSFVYTPAAGTVLGYGNGQNLHVAFTPTDTTNYNGATRDVAINVLSALLTTTMTVDRNPALVGYNHNYLIDITNNGNASATSMTLSDPLPSQVRFTAVTTTQGSCAYNSGTHTVNCTLGTLGIGSTIHIQLTTKTLQTGTLNNTATVNASQWDPATGGNTASVNGLQAIALTDVSVSKVDSADPIYVSQQTTYTIVVRNYNTPINATGVVMSDNLPASFQFVSATTTQGSLITPPVGSTGIVTANIGTLAVNGTATITITVRATTSGVITNTATVSENENDSNSANNSSSQSTTVNDATLQKVLLAKQVLTGGCENTTGNVYLSGPAPNGGLTVSLSTTNLAGVTVPASVFIPAGQTVSPAFNVTTSPVATKQVGTVNATLGSSTVSRGLTINVGSGSCGP